jgi:hypothetical protein
MDFAVCIKYFHFVDRHCLWIVIENVSGGGVYKYLYITQIYIIYYFLTVDDEVDFFVNLRA